YDHLRLLFARVGVPHCPTHGIPIVAQTVQEIVDQISAMPEGSRILVLGPLVRDRKAEHQQLFATARRGGFARVRADGFGRDFSIGEIEPRTFSFNSPHGACPACTGLGTKLEPDPELVLGNPDLSLKDGAVLPWQKSSGTAQYRIAILEGLARKFKFSLDTPI